MSPARTEAACLKAALADLPRFLPIVEPVDHQTVDRIAAWGRDHLASLTPERRAELQAEWGA